MSFARNRRIALIVPTVCLVLALGAAPAHAAGSGADLSSWWSWLLAWSGLDRITSATGQADVGPVIDPFGGNRTTSNSGQTDSGPVIDPNGGNRG